MAALKLRDRDAIITKEGLIFRVFGYSHPQEAYICDVEYAPAEVFNSKNPKAIRNKASRIFCKFYEDEGWKFFRNNFPQYMVSYEMLGTKVVGVKREDIVKVRKPEKELRKLVRQEPKDKLHAALKSALGYVSCHSGLLTEDFGVFGSLLHRFYHPEFSDIDLIVYGRKSLVKLLETLREFYGDAHSVFRNEFESLKAVEGKNWRFQNCSLKEFVWHQQRKLIYSLFSDEKSGRIIKTEFEPVKDWKEIHSEYDSRARIVQEGWVKMLARVTSDTDAPFIPSVYSVEPLEVLAGSQNVHDVKRIVSYMEEFRMQAFRDETVYVEGNLEEVATGKGSFWQIVLTYCPRYYEQVLKVASHA